MSMTLILFYTRRSCECIIIGVGMQLMPSCQLIKNLKQKIYRIEQNEPKTKKQKKRRKVLGITYLKFFFIPTHGL